QLNGASSFAQGLLLPPESGINDTEHAPCRAVICLSLDGFLLLRACSSKSQLRLVLVIGHACDNAFHERTREMNRVATSRDFVRRDQGLLGGSDVALGQRAN